MVGDPNGTGGTTDPTNAGDPDIPINTGKCTLKPMSRTTRPASTTYSSPVSVGDATTAQLVWLYKFRIALQMFRVFVLR